VLTDTVMHGYSRVCVRRNGKSRANKEGAELLANASDRPLKSSDVRSTGLRLREVKVFSPPIKRVRVI
jgi:hypothetical protein